jgi:hypothetical protein
LEFGYKYWAVKLDMSHVHPTILSFEIKEENEIERGKSVSSVEL